MKKFVTIQYAPKPWDRGRPPMTRTIEAPYAYTEEQMRHWLWEKLLIKSGETIVSVIVVNKNVARSLII